MKTARPKFGPSYWVVAAPGGFVWIATMRSTRKAAIGKFVELRKNCFPEDRPWRNCQKMGYRTVKVRVAPIEELPR